MDDYPYCPGLKHFEVGFYGGSFPRTPARKTSCLLSLIGSGSVQKVPNFSAHRHRVLPAPYSTRLFRRGEIFGFGTGLWQTNRILSNFSAEHQRSIFTGIYRILGFHYLQLWRFGRGGVNASPARMASAGSTRGCGFGCS